MFVCLSQSGPKRRRCVSEAVEIRYILPSAYPLSISPPGTIRILSLFGCFQPPHTDSRIWHSNSDAVNIGLCFDIRNFMQDGTDATPHPSKLQSTDKASQAQDHSSSIVTRYFHAFQELSDLSTLAVQGILHPIDSLSAYVLPSIFLNMFGGISFNPAQDISDLSGKVVLVTGGKRIAACSSCT